MYYNQLISNTVQVYLKCVFLADNTSRIGFRHEAIFKSIEELIRDMFMSGELFDGLPFDSYKNEKYKLYAMSEKINFGEYNGYSVKEILEKNPKYLLWCVINLSDFALDNRIMVDKRILQHDIYAQAVGINLIKNNFIGIWDSDLEDEANDELETSRNYNWERETFDALTDGQIGDWDDFGGDFDDAKNSMGLD